MKQALYCIFFLALTACNTVAFAPLDDAYYWPEKQTALTTTPSVSSTPSAPSVSSASSSSMEVINQQDTTVTIRIKR